MENQHTRAAFVCTCDRYAPNKWKLTSPDFLADLARDLLIEGVPSSQIVYQAIDGLLSAATSTRLMTPRDSRVMETYSTNANNTPM